MIGTIQYAQFPKVCFALFLAMVGCYVLGIILYPIITYMHPLPELTGSPNGLGEALRNARTTGLSQDSNLTATLILALVITFSSYKRLLKNLRSNSPSIHEDILDISD